MDKIHFPKKELVLLATHSGASLANIIDKHLVRIRREQWNEEFKNFPERKKLEFLKQSYLVGAQNPHFGTGELKSVIDESVNEAQIFIIADIVNPTEYNMRGTPNRSSAIDNFYQALSMANAADSLNTEIHLVMPYFFSGRQDKIKERESLDLELACNMVKAAGISSVVTLDAHSPDVLRGALGKKRFNDLHSSYHHIRLFLEIRKQLEGNDFSLDDWEITGPDAGANDRSDFYSRQLKGKPSIHGMDKLRDFKEITDGYNNLISHEYHGPPFTTNILMIDDIIGSGRTSISAASIAKTNGAKKVDLMASHGLFLKGADCIIKAHEEGIIDQVYITDACYVPPEVLRLPYVHVANSLDLFGHYINRMNRGKSRSELLDNKDKIQDLLMTMGMKYQP